jgi:fusaric acid resistance family protein
MSATSEIVREAFRTQERGLDWRSGLAGAVAAVGPLAIGVGIDRPAAGLTAAIGGLNTALCVPRADLRARAWWGSLAALGGVAALAAAGAANGSDASLIVVSLVWVAFWALFRADGPTGALTGFAIAAVFVILAGVPETAPLGQRVGWFALGAFPSLALMIVARRGSTRSPPVGRRALRAVRTALLHDTALQVHAVRLAVAVGAGTVIYRLADLPHGYWVPLTTLAIVQPTEHDTFLRSIQRSAGTLAAGALILAVTLATDHRWPLLALAAASAFLLYALDERGYFWLVLLITPTALLMFSTVDFQGDTVAVDRVGDSMLGIAIGLAIGELARARPFVRLARRLSGGARQPDGRSWR